MTGFGGKTGKFDCERAFGREIAAPAHIEAGDYRECFVCYRLLGHVPFKLTAVGT